MHLIDLQIHLGDRRAPRLTAASASGSMPADVGSCRIRVIVLGQLDT